MQAWQGARLRRYCRDLLHLNQIASRNRCNAEYSVLMSHRPCFVVRLD